MDANTQLIVGIIVALITMFLVYKASKVRGNQIAGVSKGFMVLFLLVLTGGALWIGGVGSYLSPSLASQLTLAVTTDGTTGGTGGPITPQNLNADILGCDLGTKTTVTLSAIDKYSSASAGTSHRYRINGAPALTVSNAGTFTASPGDTLNILWGNETEASYFGELDSFIVPCTGAKTYSRELVKNGTLTMDVFNTDGNKIDGGANNQTIGADDAKNVRIRLQGPSKAGYPHGGVLVLELNGSEYDENLIELTSSQITIVSGADVPDAHSVTATDRKTKAWAIGAIQGTGEIDFNLYLDSDATNNPIDLNDPVLSFYPNDYFVNEDNGGAYEGPATEDEDNVQTFLYKPSVTISVS